MKITASNKADKLVISPLFRNILVVALYLIAAVFYTWPLVTDLNNHVFGTFPIDREQNFWYLWWTRQALDQHVNPFFTNYLYYPDGVSLYLFTAYMSSAILSIPVQALFGVVPAYNFLVFVSLVGCSWGAYSLCYYVTGKSAPAFVGGLIFAFSPWFNYTADLSHMNMMTAQWLPFFALFLLKFFDVIVPPGVAIGEVPENRRKYQVRYGTLTAIFFVLIAQNGYYQLMFGSYLGLILTLWYIFKLFRQGYRKEIIRFTMLAAALVLPALISFIPMLVGAWGEINSGNRAKGTETTINGLEVMGLVLPARPQFGGYIPELKDTGSGLPTFSIPIGYLALTLGLVGFFKRRNSRFWGILWLVALVLALGTQVKLAGLSIPMPSLILTKLPVLSILRDNSRWTIPAFLGLAVLAAWGVVVLMEWLPRYRYGVLSLVLVLFLFELWPFPTLWSRWEVNPIPKPYTTGVLANPGVLLELPIDERNYDKADNINFQVFHQHPIVGGYLSRQAFTDLSQTYSFFYEKLTPAPVDIVSAGAQEAQSFLSYYNFSYIALYRSVGAEREKVFRQIIEQALGSTVKPCIYQDVDVLICQVTRPEKLVPFLSLPNGWYGAEKAEDGRPYRWLYGQEGVVSVFVPETTQYNFSFEAAAYLKDRPLLVEMDGKPVSNLTIMPARKEYNLPINLEAGTHRLRLYSAVEASRPSANGGSPNDTRALTLLFAQLRFTPAQ